MYLERKLGGHGVSRMGRKYRAPRGDADLGRRWGPEKGLLHVFRERAQPGLWVGRRGSNALEKCRRPEGPGLEIREAKQRA